MNGETGIDVVSDVLNQPDVQADYPMDFTGYMYEEPVFDIEMQAYVPPPEPFDIEMQAYVPPPEPFDIEMQAYVPPPLMKEQSSLNEMVNFFGKVLDVAGKTYQQLAATKEVQNLKATPYVSSALNALGYPTVRKAQTGVDTGILTTPLSSVKKAVSSISSLSPMILIFGVGVLVLVMVVMKGKK